MRGFITIATGSEHYYKLARQLLRSLRCCSKEPAPFALLCDKENEYTTEFDYVILMDHPQRSYMDKLSIYRYSPFQETIFIDADSLILKDPSALWDDFSDGSPVSCYGKVFPNGSDGGWFRYEQIGKWKGYVKYQIDLHGGIYYFRKGTEAQLVFETAIQLSHEYADYNFKNFIKPADEPVIALSMAIRGCAPVEKDGRIIFVHSVYRRLKLSCAVLYLDGEPCDAIVCHFATRNTYCYLYRYLSELVDMRYIDPSDKRMPDSWRIRKTTLKYDTKNWIKYTSKRILKHIVSMDKLRRIMSRLS